MIELLSIHVEGKLGILSYFVLVNSQAGKALGLASSALHLLIKGK